MNTYTAVVVTKGGRVYRDYGWEEEALEHLFNNWHTEDIVYLGPSGMLWGMAVRTAEIEAVFFLMESEETLAEEEFIRTLAYYARTL